MHCAQSAAITIRLRIDCFSNVGATLTRRAILSTPSGATVGKCKSTRDLEALRDHYMEGPSGKRPRKTHVQTANVKSADPCHQANRVKLAPQEPLPFGNASCPSPSRRNGNQHAVARHECADPDLIECSRAKWPRTCCTVTTNRASTRWTLQGPWSFDGDGTTFRLVAEAHRIRFAHLFDPLLTVHTSLVEPLPHQITAVYEPCCLGSR